MRKSVILPGVAVAGGLVGLLVRRVYLAHGFEAGTGLPISGAPSLWAMVLVSAAVAAALLVLSRGKHRKFDQCYTGAFSPDTTPLLSGALAGAVLLAIGGFLALAAWAGSPRTLLGQRTMSIAWAGLGVLSLLAPPFSPPGPWSPALPAACGSWPTTTRAGRRSPCWVST